MASKKSSVKAERKAPIPETPAKGEPKKAQPKKGQKKAARRGK